MATPHSTASADIPDFGPDTTEKTFPVVGPDGRLKMRTETWRDGVCLRAEEYDQLLYGDPT